MGFLISILSKPAYIVGFMTMIGLILQKKEFPDVLKGTLKTIIGFIIVNAGTAFLEANALNQFGEVFNYAFGLQGVLSSNEAVIGAGLTTFAVDTAYIMILAMVLNIVLCKFSRLNYVFLTGNHVFVMSMVLSVVLSVSGLNGIAKWLCGALFTALLAGISPALCEPTMRKVTGSDNIALGHFGGVGYMLSGLVGRLFKGKSKSTEEVNFPKSLSFFRDNMCSIGITMALTFFIITAVAVSKGMLAEDPSMFPSCGDLFALDIVRMNWIHWAINAGLSFSAALSISLMGIQLVISELVISFKGNTDKFIPDAIPAVDCPITYTFAPNAVLIGFISSFLGGVVGMIILALMNRGNLVVPVIIPGVVAHFYCGATAGVFGNAEGGVKGCVAGAFVHGLLITFLGALIMPILTEIGFVNTTFSDSDFSLITLFVGSLYKFMRGTPVLIVSIVCFLIPIAYNYLVPKKENK